MEGRQYMNTRKFPVLATAIGILIALLSAPAGNCGEFDRYTLPNGMVVVLAPDHSTPAVSMNIWVNVGAFNELDSESGMSHFIEHLLFDGSTNLKPGEGASLIEAAGGDFNAYTDHDNTVLTATVASRFVETVIRVVSETALTPLFDDKEVERERQVILEEIRRGLDDPQDRLSELLFEKAFIGHPYEKPVIGTTERVTSYTRDSLYRYYTTHYRPDNMVMVLVGDFDPATVKPMIRRYLDAAGPAGRLIAPSAPSPVNAGPVIAGITKPVHTASVYIAFNTIPITHGDLFSLDVSSFILGTGKDSRLYRAVVDTGLAYSISSYSYTPKQAGLFFISATLDESKMVPAIEAIIREVSRLSREPVAADELAKAETGTTADFIFNKETYASRAGSLGFYETATGTLDFEKRYLKGVETVTTRDIMKAAKKYLAPENMTIVYLVPSSDTRPISDEEIKAAALRTFSEPATADSGLPEIAAGPPAGYKAVLPNGVRLVIKEDHSLPIISVAAVFDGGVRYETAANNGIGNLTAMMLTRGTARLTAQALAERVDRIAANVSGFSGRDSLGLKAQFLTTYQDEGWDIVADVLRNPSFDTDQMDKAKEIAGAAIDQGKDDLVQRTLNLFKKTLYRDYPYALPILGTKESLASISRDDLISYYGRVAVPEHMVISVVGDVNPDEVLKRVYELFGDLRTTGPAALTLKPVVKPASPVRISETEPGKEQAHIMYGFLGTDYLSDDYYGMDVLTAVLSGMGGRMFMELRERQGLAYAVEAFSVGGVAPGFFGVYMATAPKNLPAAVGGIKEELKRIRDEGITPEELSRAKNYLIGNFELSLQTNLETASLMAADELYGLGYDFFRRYPEKIDAVTESDVRRIAETYLNQQNSILTIITPP
jgi:zinc protease